MQPGDPHILLVEDDLRLRGLLETFLHREGFRVTAVGNSQQMQKSLLERPVDLIVLDLMLPGRGGLDICRDLRAGGNSLPIVMLTAKGDDIDRIVGLEIGADDYLPKPCNPRELVARIRAVLYALVSHPGETLSRERLLAAARGRQRGAFDRSIDVQVSRLRRLIEPHPATPRYLQTVWGSGYVFVPDDSAGGDGGPQHSAP